MHDACIGECFRLTKITCKASDVTGPAIISSCSVLPHEMVMHDAYIGACSENNIKCVVVHNNLGRKNQTTRYNCRLSVASLALRVIFSVSYLWTIFGSFTEPFNCNQYHVYIVLLFWHAQSCLLSMAVTFNAAGYNKKIVDDIHVCVSEKVGHSIIKMNV